MKWIRKVLMKGLVDYGLIKIKIKTETKTETIKKMNSIKLKDEIQRKVLDKNSFETAEWINALLFEILCTSKSRRLIDADQEALLSALTRISREAVESKLSDYQKDSWLFLSSLDLDSFFFGERLPLIQKIRIPYYKTGSFAVVMDISYAGGIKCGLKAAMALNFRDFAASINFTPSQFKFIMKMDAEPTPRVSVMLSDVPAYEMNVTMRSRQLERASNLIKLIIGNLLRSRLCYPNYMTILFSDQEKKVPFARIANSKQYQSQLRIRLVSFNLNSEHVSIIPLEEGINVMAVLSLGEITCKTEVINAELSNTRWNSIHTFNIFNGLDNSPNCLQISLYQVIDSRVSVNQLGRIEIPYSSITPEFLDIRTLPLSTDPNSTISLEMYLHHMEEDGEKDSNWIFWNCPKPPRRKPDQDKKVEQINWDTIKFIVSKLSADTEAESEADDNSINTSSLQEQMTSSRESIDLETDAVSNENLLDLILKLLNKVINRLTKSNSDPQAVDILNAFHLELDDFSKRFNLTRPALSSQALPAHNERLASLIRPLVRSFIPEALRILRGDKESDHFKLIRDLERIQALTIDPKKLEPTNDSSPELFNRINPEIGAPVVLSEFKAFLGDEAVIVKINEADGLTCIEDPSTCEGAPQFDFEAIFYTNEHEKSVNFASSKLFDTFTTWEVSLLQNRFLSFVPLGQSHLFPHRVVDIEDLSEIEVIKDRNAFTLGFNADLSTKEAFQHANNGLLRLTLKDGEKLDLFGESRSCDQWFCLLSSRIRPKFTETFDWKDINKIWLLPLNLPSLTCPYALALRHETLTYVFIIGADQLYNVYCKIKTIWLSKREFLGLDLLRERSPSLSSSTSSISQKSSAKQTSSIFSFSRSNSSKPDQFTSKSRYDRLVMSNNPRSSDDLILSMTSVDEYIKNNTKLWPNRITNDSVVFNCTITNLPAGFIALGTDFICYWTKQSLSISGLPIQSPNIFLLPRVAILDVSKSTANWISSFSGIILKLKREFHRQTDPIILTNFNNSQEMELVFDYLLGIN